MTLTMKSTVKDLWDNPIGRDALSKILLQLGRTPRWITNPAVSRLRLSALARLTGSRLTGGAVPQSFYDTLLRLLNTESDVPAVDSGDTVEPAWWKEAVFYQIYPRSFKDSNGDGIGDLGGIIEKLDYLRDLGVDALWLSPIYDSPNDDNGYDIRDYQKIMAEFGTMEDFDRLLDGVHQRGMKLIMDLVVNHTSDEHRWFTEALADADSPYRDYYIFRPGSGEDGQQPPNNWVSFFSGSAWNQYPGIGASGEDLWGLHLFSKKQMDLSWENANVRKDVVDMVSWWLTKGVDGFRLDVINYISKQHDLPDGDPTIGALMEFTGVENYFYGPRLHEYLHQLKTEAFEPFGAFSVGETPGIGMEMAKLLTSSDRRELDMVFSFDHLETPGHTRYDDYEYDLNYFKDFLVSWTEGYPSSCWMSLFWNNHDNPRMISKVSQDPAYRERLATLLATMQLTSKGTPFIFQGDELGMVNQKFSSIADIRDVEAINLYATLEEKATPEEAWNTILTGTRDHSRVGVQWDATDNGGFTTGEPWIRGDGDWTTINAADQAGDPLSVLEFYRSLIALRRKTPALVYGTVEFHHVKRKNYLAYTREHEGQRWFVEMNLSKEPISRSPLDGEFTLELSNYSTRASQLRPYEANMYWLVSA